jgi:rhomboid protease GluP
VRVTNLTVTKLLIAANVVAFGWLIVRGGFAVLTGATTDFYVAHGALVPVFATQYGQWWRIVSSAFLHGSLIHIGVNMIALYIVGSDVERLMGPLRYALLYAIAMAGAGLAVIYFAPYDSVTLGASGAIFGLFGALVAIGLSLLPRGMTLVTRTLPVIGINLAFGFAVPGISNEAHLGGVITGFVAGWLLYQIPSARRRAVYAALHAPVAVETIDRPPLAVETIEHPPDAGPHEEAGAPPLEVRDPRE